MSGKLAEVGIAVASLAIYFFWIVFPFVATTFGIYWLWSRLGPWRKRTITIRVTKADANIITCALTNLSSQYPLVAANDQKIVTRARELAKEISKDWVVR